DWNAQISLLTGFAAASMMVAGKVGILRTLPPADPRAVKRLRRTARGLGIDWPAAQDYPAFIRSLDATKPSHLAMVTACTSLLRGKGGQGFTGVVVEADRDEDRKGGVMVREVAVEASVTGTTTLPLGEEIAVTLEQADPATRTVRFTRAG